MLLKVKVFPCSKKEEIIKTEDGKVLEVRVKEKPINNQANKRLFLVLSQYFKVPLSGVKLIRGARKRNKIFEIKNDK
jgi:uncharacterized protein (TIGR00251 family)